MYENVDLPERAIEVLGSISNYPSPTTTTLKESHHWADKNQHIHYRLDQLEEKGFIETWKDEDAGGRGPLAARRATTTDAGEELLDELENHDQSHQSVEERVNNLESKIEQLTDNYVTMKQAVIELEEVVEEHDEDLENVAEEVENVKRFVSENVDVDG